MMGDPINGKLFVLESRKEKKEKKRKESKWNRYWKRDFF